MTFRDVPWWLKAMLLFWYLIVWPIEKLRKLWR
jgi:hypothetical protein